MLYASSIKRFVRCSQFLGGKKQSLKTSFPYSHPINLYAHMSIYLYVFSLICLSIYPLVISSVNLPIHLFPPCMVMNLVVNQSSTSLGLFGTVVLAKTLERDVILCAVMHLQSINFKGSSLRLFYAYRLIPYRSHQGQMGQTEQVQYSQHPTSIRHRGGRLSSGTSNGIRTYSVLQRH